jgi:hypothetical protein
MQADLASRGQGSWLDSRPRHTFDEPCGMRSTCGMRNLHSQRLASCAAVLADCHLCWAAVWRVEALAHCLRPQERTCESDAKIQELADRVRSLEVEASGLAAHNALLQREAEPQGASDGLADMQVGCVPALPSNKYNRDADVRGCAAPMPKLVQQAAAGAGGSQGHAPHHSNGIRHCFAVM